MKKLILIAFAMFLGTFIVSAQDSQRKCGTMEYLEQMKTDDPSLEAQMQMWDDQMEQWIADNKDYIATSKAVITVPVVVHVVYSSTSQNVTDARVLEQINVLNRDYAGLNTHSMGSFSTSLRVNTELQFCLAQRTPGGAATSGIERRQTTVTSFSTNNAVKYYSNGGLSAWDPTKYMNIWVCNLGGGLCGYAQFPTSGVNATFGVVINYQYFGVTGAVSPYNLGGTTTHEIGHCFNLYHIWGDDGGACTGTDYCSDVPNQANATYGHHTGVLTDACSTTSPGIQYMNFMDYSDDLDYANFTPNQKARIVACFSSSGPLYSLTTSNGCTPPTPGTCDVPSGLTATSIASTTATLSWTAVSAATSYNIQYRKTGTTTWSSTTSTTNSKAVSGLTASTSYEYQVQTVCSSGSSSFSSSYTFTTTSSGGGCTDNYESNNSISAAKLIAVNTTISALISTSTDVDFFKFSNTSAMKNIKVTLSGLPKDYDLKLYNSSGTLLATSQNGGTTAEAIKYNNAPVGTYYIKVYGYGGVYSATSCYSLIANISATAYKTDGEVIEEPNTPADISLYPNPAKDQATLAYNIDKDCSVTLKLYDITGSMKSENVYTATKGLNTYTIDLTGFIKGLYIMELNNGSEVVVKKLMVEK
ncbi:MAG: M43 family zinc metalloprotease [Bacteroidota bacterium]